jgi:hypothetical protein
MWRKSDLKEATQAKYGVARRKINTNASRTGSFFSTQPQSGWDVGVAIIDLAAKDPAGGL